MPPWKPEPGFGSFHDERRLSESEIQKIGAWAECRSSRGRRQGPAATPRFPGWLAARHAGPRPQSVRAVQCAGAGPRHLPLLRDSDPDRFQQDGRGGRVSPGQPQGRPPRAALPRQHRGRARRKTNPSPAPATPASAGLASCRPAAWGAGLPGRCPGSCPTAWASSSARGATSFFRSTTTLIGKAEKDQSVVGIYFTKKPAQKIVGGIAVRTPQPRHPARRSTLSYDREAASRLPVDVRPSASRPHMHYIGKEMKVVAETPDGKTIPLIWIKDWDFNWQGQYQFQLARQARQGDGHQARRLLRQFGG